MTCLACGQKGHPSKKYQYINNLKVREDVITISVNYNNTSRKDNVEETATKIVSNDTWE